MKTEIDTIITLPGEGYGLAFEDPKALEVKRVLLKNAALIVEVNEPISNDAALAQIKELAKWRNSVEKCRVIVKQPILDKGKEIDGLAKAAVIDTDTAEKRLMGMVGTYAAKVELERQRIAREIEAKRREEAKAAAEAEAARLKAERDAEAARIAAEQAAKASAAAFWEEDESAAKESAEAAAKAKEAQRLAQEEQERIAAEASAAAARPAVVEFVPAKAEGVKFIPDFEVTDEHALYAYSAALVSLTPKRAEILALVKQLTTGDNLPTIPGLRIFKKPVVSTR